MKKSGKKMRLFLLLAIVTLTFAFNVSAAGEVDLAWQYNGGPLSGTVPQGGLAPNSTITFTATFLGNAGQCSSVLGYKLYRTMVHAIGGNTTKVEYLAKGALDGSSVFTYDFNSGAIGQRNVYWAIVYCWSSSSPETALGTAQQWKSDMFDQTTVSAGQNPPTNNSSNTPRSGTDISGGKSTTGGTKDLPGVDLTIQGLGNLVIRLTCWVIQIILAVMVIALLVAGVRFFLARGNPEAAKGAKENFKWVLAGIAVILATNIIIATIAGFLGADYQYVPLDCTNVSTNVTFPDAQQ